MPEITVNNTKTLKRYDFSGTALPTEWNILQQGGGMAVSVANSAMTISAGTTSGAQTIIRCTSRIRIKSYVRFILQLSQRIAGQNIYLEITNEAGTTFARYDFSGTNAGQVQCVTSNRGSANAALTVACPNTANFGTFDIYADTNDVVFSSVASNSNSAKSGVASFDRLTLEPDEDYFIQVRVVNTSTPASSTTVNIDAVVLQDLTGVKVDIVRGDGTAAVSNAAPVQVVNAYDVVDDMLKVKSVQKKFRDSFIGASVDANRWDVVTGAGATVSVSGGVLTMGSGTTANAETSLLSREVFTVPFRLSIGLTLSQRIANQTFLVEAVSVDPGTGLPNGLHSCAILFDGTTATQAKYRVQNGGLAALDSPASTFPTSASGSVFEIEPFADEVWFHGGTLDSTAGRSNSYRRHQQIPDPTALYKLRLRWLNGASAPASSTNAVVQYVACQDYAELTAEITAGRGQVVAGQAVGVAVVSAPVTPASQSGTWTVQPGNTANTTPWLVTNRGNVFFNESTTNLGASATFTGTGRDVGIAAGSVQPYSAFNATAFADVAGTMRLEMSNDNTTWRRCTADAAVAANTPVTLSVPVVTRYYRVVFVNSTSAQTAFMLNSGFTAA